MTLLTNRYLLMPYAQESKPAKLSDMKLAAGDIKNLLKFISDISGLRGVLVKGNTTGGKSIVISDGDFIEGSGGQIQLDFGSDAFFSITTDAGAYGTPYFTVSPTNLSLAGLGSGGVDIIAAFLGIGHGTRVTISSPAFRVTAVGGGGVKMLITDNAGNITTAAIAKTPVINEVPTGAVDGLNRDFTTANNYVSGSLAVYYNSGRQTYGTDFTETGANTYNMAVAPLLGSTMVNDYLK